MAPVIPVVSLPCRNAARDDRPVDRARELLEAREQRVAAAEPRHGLQEPELRVRNHLAHQRHERIRREDAVRVEHDHEVVPAAPARDEIAQVAGLLPDVLGAVAVPDAHALAERLAQRMQRRGLVHVDGRVGRVRQHEDLEGVRVAQIGQRLGHRLERRERTRRIFVVDGHHERSALLDRRIRAAMAPYSAEQDARDGGRRRQRDPTEGDREQHDHHALKRAHAADGHDGDHLARRVRRERNCAAERDQAREPRLEPRPRDLALARIALEVLVRHLEQRERRHGGLSRGYRLHRYSHVSLHGRSLDVNSTRSSTTSARSGASSKLTR